MLGVNITLLQTIRTSLLDVREKAYERSGLGSSYLFRIDESWAVDATRQVRPSPHTSTCFSLHTVTAFCNEEQHIATASQQ